MDDFGELLGRIEALVVRARRPDDDPGLLAELEDVLSTGYATALASEARMVALEGRIDELLRPANPLRDQQLLDVLREHRELERAVARLRSRLAGAHEQFVALGGARLAPQRG